jgi:osmotically-inducible protein OsmY
MTLSSLASVEEALRDAVVSELVADPNVIETEIGIAVEDGVVTLTGHVPSLSARIAAECAVKRVDGVRSIANDLLVTHQGERSDTEIAREALHRLRNNVAVPIVVQAVVSDGHITLDGIVSWMFQRVAAENAVKHLRGVKSVTNAIAVRGDRPGS